MTPSIFDPVLTHMGRAEQLARGVYRTIQPERYSVEDAIGEAHLALVEAAARYDPARNSSFWGYARARVKGQVIDAINGVHSEDKAVEPLDERNSERRLDAERLMKYFTHREARMIELRIERGYKYRQIGEAFGISHQSAMKAIKRALYRAQRTVLVSTRAR